MTYAPIALVALRERTLGRDVALVGAGAVVTALAAQVSVPWEPVPFTLQTLAVTLCGLSLGARRGAASQVAYLLAGACGAPVFANGTFGAQRLFGPTGGYLLAFVLAAWILGWAAERGWSRSVLRCAVALTVANAVILAMGAGWLSLFVGGAAAVATGVVPFISGAVVKSVAAMLALPAAWRVVGDE